MSQNADSRKQATQNGKPAVAQGGQLTPKEQQTHSSSANSTQQQQQSPKPQRQLQRPPREQHSDGGGGGGEGRGGGRGGGYRGGGRSGGPPASQHHPQQQNYHQNYNQNGYRPARQKQPPQPPPEYAIKPATDAENIAKVMQEGQPEQMQATLLELINQRADLDHRLVTLSDQVVQKGSSYLSMEAQLKSTVNILADTRAEREQTVNNLQAQLSSKTAEVQQLLEQLQGVESQLESASQEHGLRERELAGARSQLEEAVRKLAVCEEEFKQKAMDLVKAQSSLEEQKARVDEIERRGRLAEEQVQQMKVSLGHKDFQNYQMVDKIRGMELHFQNQYARWNQDRQNLEQELYKMKSIQSDLMPFGNEGMSTDMGTANNPGFTSPIPPTGAGLKLLSDKELLNIFAIIINEGRANAKPWTQNEELMLDNFLQPFKWSENYAGKYGTMVDFIRQHNAVFKEREEDGWVYRQEGVLSQFNLPPQPNILPPGMMPPLPPHGFPMASSGGGNLLPIQGVNKLGGDFSNGMMDDMQGVGNPMMQFLNPNQNMPLPPMLVTPLAPQKASKSVAQTQVDEQENGLVNRG
eukprot:TRINITY_DN893_c0_g3_i1.p1 TRINITY_DN893_c0_g3~~TRINITY_DN893_c0_g3_i1.p1  ORF type:complete len:580 (+),score=123.72 TRINITY_DN893_c0_g3_i1:166-1905(+)